MILNELGAIFSCRIAPLYKTVAVAPKYCSIGDTSNWCRGVTIDHFKGRQVLHSTAGLSIITAPDGCCADSLPLRIVAALEVPQPDPIIAIVFEGFL